MQQVTKSGNLLPEILTKSDKKIAESQEKRNRREIALKQHRKMPRYVSHGPASETHKLK